MKDVFKFLEEQNENFDHLLDEITEEDIDIAIEETFEEEVKNEGIIDRMLAGRNKEGSKKWVTKKPETQEGRKNKLGPRTKQSNPYESNEAFKPHMMYDPKTGKGYKAEKEEDHLRMKKMGYTHVKESVQIFEATDFKATFDSLKKGDTVKIKYGNSISRQQEGTFKVTFKSVVGKAKVGKITLVKQGEGAAKVKHYLYDRNGKVSMAMGDMGASMTSLVKESVELDEGIVTKTLTGLVDKGLNKVLDKLEKMTGKHLGLVQKSKIPSTGKDRANNVLNYIGTPKFHDAKKLKKESEDFHRKAKKQWTWSKREVGDSFKYYGDKKIPTEQKEAVSDLQAEMQKIIDMHTQLEKMMQTTGNSVKYQRTMEKLERDTNRVFKDIAKVTERGNAKYRAMQGMDNLRKAKKLTHGEPKKGSSVKFRAYANRGESVDEEVSIDEKKNSQSNYDLYHSSFSGAMQHAYKHAKDAHGITVHSSEIDDKVASGPRKPVNGKTNSYRLKGDKGNIQVQVYNRGGSKPFELNMYKESVIEDAEMIIENVSPKQIAMLKKQYSSMPDRLPVDQAMKMSKMVAKFDKASLMKVAKADIKWLSSAAKTNLISKHGATAKDFKEDMSVHGAPSHSADKKPQNYRKPDGKMGVKMVPMDSQTTRKESVNVYDANYDAENHSNGSMSVKKIQGKPRLIMKSWHKEKDGHSFAKKHGYKVKNFTKTLSGTRMDVHNMNESVELDEVKGALGMESAAKALEKYAKASGGMDEKDFMTAARLLRKGLDMKLKKFVNDMDTEPREKVITTMAKTLGKKPVEKMFGVRLREASNYVSEKLKPSDGMAAYIKDFIKSDAPQFKGKDEKKRKEMAIAAYVYAKSRARD